MSCFDFDGYYNGSFFALRSAFRCRCVMWGLGSRPRSPKALHQMWRFAVREVMIPPCHSKSRHAGDWISTVWCQLGPQRSFLFPLCLIYFHKRCKILITEDSFYKQQGLPPPHRPGFACWLNLSVSAFTHEQTFT